MIPSSHHWKFLLLLSLYIVFCVVTLIRVTSVMDIIEVFNFHIIFNVYKYNYRKRWKDSLVQFWHEICERSTAAKICMYCYCRHDVKSKICDDFFFGNQNCKMFHCYVYIYVIWYLFCFCFVFLSFIHVNCSIYFRTITFVLFNECVFACLIVMLIRYTEIKTTCIYIVYMLKIVEYL